MHFHGKNRESYKRSITDLASSSGEIGMPFLLQEMSMGRSPVASQISEALSPFLTESLTNFSLKCGGAGKDEAIYAFGMGVLVTTRARPRRQRPKRFMHCANANGLS